MMQRIVIVAFGLFVASNGFPQSDVPQETTFAPFITSADPIQEISSQAPEDVTSAAPDATSSVAPDVTSTTLDVTSTKAPPCNQKPSKPIHPVRPENPFGGFRPFPNMTPFWRPVQGHSESNEHENHPNTPQQQGPKPMLFQSRPPFNNYFMHGRIP